LLLRFATDENFDHTILRGLLRKQPDLNIITIQSAGLSGSTDAQVLEWAVKQQRILLTHDVSTIARYAIERIRDGKPMSGVVEVGSNVTIGNAIDDILLLAECALPEELNNMIVHLPLR
jgi:predicted nuclease of predicted toxin-antitoxin system